MTEKSLSDVPAASTESVRRRMSCQAKKDTQAELGLRSALFARGLRYRLHLRVPNVPRRTIDIAFPGSRVAVFVDGCFWHGCPEHGRRVKTNSAWWERKIDRNRERDLDTDKRLEAQGWFVVRVWEHESVDDACDRVQAAIAQRQQPPKVTR